MRIGLLTIHHADNYGSALQCYATQRMLTELGHEAVILDYICPKIDGEYGVHRIISQHGIIRKLEAAVRVFYLIRARKAFQRFREQYYKMAPFDRNQQEEYDFFLVGSDQVWNYQITGCDRTYLLDFVKENGKKISYASSFGISQLPSGLAPAYKELLSGFSALSVREEEGAALIEKLVGRKVPVVIDPVFLVPKLQWEAIAEIPERKGYILLYYIAYSQTLMDFAQGLAQKTGKTIVSIQGSLRRRIEAEYIWDAGPAEYLGLIMNADYVITNSFHGTAFSLIFHKKFFVEMLPSFEKTNSRLNNIIRLFGMEKRLILDGQSLSIDEEPDDGKIDRVIREEKQRAAEYLTTAIPV